MGKRFFDILCSGVCVVKDLIGGAVWIFGFVGPRE